jgi:hypothetical protein
MLVVCASIVLKRVVARILGAMARIFLAALGDQDPMNKDGNEGPILSCLADLDTRPDFCVILALHSPHSPARPSDLTREKRLEQLEAAITEELELPCLPVFRNLGNAAKINSVRSELNSILSLLVTKLDEGAMDWTETDVFASSGTMAIQIALIELALSGALANPRIIQRIQGDPDPVQVVSLKFRFRMAALQRLEAHLKAASWEAARSELLATLPGSQEPLFDPDHRSVVLGSRWLEMLSALDRLGPEGFEAASGLAQAEGDSLWVEEMKDQAEWVVQANALEQALGELLILYTTLSWREAAKLHASKATRIRACIERALRASALKRIEIDGSLDCYKLEGRELCENRHFSMRSMRFAIGVYLNWLAAVDSKFGGLSPQDLPAPFPQGAQLKVSHPELSRDLLEGLNLAPELHHGSDPLRLQQLRSTVDEAMGWLRRWVGLPRVNEMPLSSHSLTKTGLVAANELKAWVLDQAD